MTSGSPALRWSTCSTSEDALDAEDHAAPDRRAPPFPARFHAEPLGAPAHGINLRRARRAPRRCGYGGNRRSNLRRLARGLSTGAVLGCAAVTRPTTGLARQRLSPGRSRHRSEPADHGKSSTPPTCSRLHVREYRPRRRAAAAVPAERAVHRGLADKVWLSCYGWAARGLLRTGALNRVDQPHWHRHAAGRAPATAPSTCNSLVYPDFAAFNAVPQVRLLNAAPVVRGQQLVNTLRCCAVVHSRSNMLDALLHIGTIFICSALHAATEAQRIGVPRYCHCPEIGDENAAVRGCRRTPGHREQRAWSSSWRWIQVWPTAAQELGVVAAELRRRPRSAVRGPQPCRRRRPLTGLELSAAGLLGERPEHRRRQHRAVGLAGSPRTLRSNRRNSSSGTSRAVSRPRRESRCTAEGEADAALFAFRTSRRSLHRRASRWPGPPRPPKIKATPRQ